MPWQPGSECPLARPVCGGHASRWTAVALEHQLALSLCFTTCWALVHAKVGRSSGG